MSDNTERTALVTGASSGLGFETASQLAERGYKRVFVTARTPEKAAETKLRLEESTGKEVFATLVLDNDDLNTVEAAAAELAGRGVRIDRLILNAGIAPPRALRLSADGFDAVVSSSLIGHHVLTIRMLEGDVLADDAAIVIAGSEAARGDVLNLKPADLAAVADEHFRGHLASAIEAYLTGKDPVEYKAAESYSNAKLFVAWWAAQLASRLPEGMTVNAVSPGSTPDTNVSRNDGFLMRNVMVPMLKLVPGMSHSVATGASRYLDVADQSGVTGMFFASPPKKLTGPLTEVDVPHIRDKASQAALWATLVKVTGGVDYSIPFEQAV